MEKRSTGRKLWWGLLLVAMAVVHVAAFGMDSTGFSTLKQKVEDASFGNEKLTLLKTAASTNTFTCEQVKELISSFSFSSEQLQGLEVLKGAIEDPEHKSTILDAFTFSSDKNKASTILADVQKAAPAPAGGAYAPPLQVDFTGAWPSSDFQSLISQLQQQSFSKDKMTVLKTAFESRPQGFTSDQVGQILRTFGFNSDMVSAINLIDERILGMTSTEVLTILREFSFSNDRLNVLTGLKDTITDPENKFIILDAFDFGSDKEKAQKILESVKGRSFIYGTVRSPQVVFVVDLSGSMAATFRTNRGDTYNRLQFVTHELEFVLEKQLPASTRFNIVLFASDVKTWQQGLVPATPQNISAAVQYLSRLQPGGGTNIYGALQRAFADSAVDTIYFLTDGMPTDGSKTDPKAIISDVQRWSSGKKATINSIAFLMGQFQGDDKPKSRDLMYELAHVTGGVYRALE